MTAVAAKPAAATQPLGRPWWMTLILGVAAIIIGGLLLFGSLTTQLRTYEMLIVLIGIWWLVDGIMNIVHIFFDHRQWGWKLFMGIIGILAGGWILIYPVYAGVALPQIFVLVLGHLGLARRHHAAGLGLPGRRLGPWCHGCADADPGHDPDRQLWRTGLGPEHDLGGRGVDVHRRLLHGLPRVPRTQGLTRQDHSQQKAAPGQTWRRFFVELYTTREPHSGVLCGSLHSLLLRLQLDDRHVDGVQPLAGGHGVLRAVAGA